MTRKRFTKLLQGMGLRRNQANEMAEIVRKYGGAYWHGWQHFLFLLADIERKVKAAVLNPFLHPDPDLLPYMGMQTEIPEYRPHIFRIDTKPIELRTVTMWPRTDPHLDVYSPKIVLVDELATAPGGGEE